MKEQTKTHTMTNEEKEKFLKRVKIQTEDVAESANPKDVFKAQLKNYQEGMQKQIEDLDNLIKVQTYLVDYEKSILDKSNELELDYNTLKSEIATKEEIISKASASKAIMRERIKKGAFIIGKAVDEFVFISELDFYLGGLLNTPGLDEMKQEIINKNIGK